MCEVREERHKFSDGPFATGYLVGHKQAAGQQADRYNAVLGEVEEVERSYNIELRPLVVLHSLHVSRGFSLFGREIFDALPVG